MQVESKALNYVLAKGWPHRISNDQIILEDCPVTGDGAWKFYMAMGGTKDGLWTNMKTGDAGNLTQLMESQGDAMSGIVSYKDSIALKSRPDSLPDVNRFHRALLEDEEALEYLVVDRGFTMAVIEQYKLGLDTTPDHMKWIVIPSFHKDNLVYIKYRTLPPNEKAFRGTSGREAPLFNYDVITDGMPELLFTEGECFTGDTEVLTPSGWVKFENYEGQEVAQWDNGIAKYVKPLAIINKEYDGNLIHFTSKSNLVDILVTENHRILYTRFQSGKNYVRPAKDVPKGSSCFYRTCNLISNGIELSDGEIKLSVAIQADGSLTNVSVRDNSDNWSLEFAKERKISRLTEILDALGMVYSVTLNPKRNTKTFKFKSPHGKYSKTFHTYFYNMNESQRKVFCDEIHHWDGHINKSNSLMYSTVIETNADLVQWAFICSNKSANKGCYVRPAPRSNLFWVNVSSRPRGSHELTSGSTITQTVIPFKGKVYCVQVPSSFLLIRRNGVVAVTGNCDALSCISNGITYCVGVPGANVHKAAWIKKLDDISIGKIFILYDNDKVGQRAAKEMAKRIGIEKCYNICLPEFTTVDGKPGKDINEWFCAGHTVEEFEVLKAQAQAYNVEGVTNMGEALDELEASFVNGELKPAVDTPWESLNRRLGGAEWGDVIGIIGEAKQGKLQPLSAKILTPTGWTTMGDLEVGTSVSSVDGLESIVTDIISHGKKDIYKITFSDGRSTLAGLDHLWEVGQVNNHTRSGLRTVTTEWLMNHPCIRGWFIPLFNGEWLQPSSLPVSPWLLGALIGDGGLTSHLIFTKADQIVVDRFIEEINQRGGQVNKFEKYSYRIVKDLPLLAYIRQEGLNCKSIYKHIPDEYLHSSREQRLELLQGLMDTDGSVEGRYNNPCFNTSSYQLALDVQYLVRSLGGIALITSRIPKYTYKGIRKEGQRAYRINIKLQDDKCFKHSHKAAREGVRSRNARLTIKSIEYYGNEETQCIVVSHPRHLYITDDFIVTHNSTVALDWLEYYTAVYNYNTLFLCLEMPPKRVARKWVSHVTNTDDTPGRSHLTLDVLKQARSIAENREAEMLLGYLNNPNKESAFELMRQAVRRYGVKIICFDNLQYLSRSIHHQTQELSVVSKMFKDIAMELGIIILLIVQPNRVQSGEIVAARNASGSSAIEKDVDAMIAIHRNRLAQLKQHDLMGVMETEDNFEPMMYLRVDLGRYCSGGICTLWMDGATSTIREMNSAEIHSAPRPVFGSTIPVEA